MAHRPPTSSTTHSRPPSRERSAQTAQGSLVSRAPQVEQARTRSAAAAMAWASGIKS